MRKILLSLSLCLLAIAANAQTPGISITEEVLYCWEEGMESANSVTFADGAKATITGNSEKKISSGKDITVGDKAYKSLKVSNGSENTFVAPAGKTPVQVTFYSYVNKDAEDNDPATFWAEVDGQTFTAETATVHKSYNDNANPDVLTFNLAGNSSFTYTNKGKQVCYVMKVAYGTITGGSTETQTPLITLTADVSGAARTFEFGSGVADNKISVDWGDGNIVDGATIADVFDGWTTTPVTGTPVGSGEIKIYATGAVTYFDCISKVDGPGITKLDVSNATDLTELYANGNKLTTFDGSKLAKLTKLELHNNSLTEVNLPSSLTTLKLDNNQLTSFDGSNCTLVTTLYLSNNNLGTLDVSMMPALKSLYALNCGLTSVNAPLKVAKAYISVNNNKLETLDMSEATGLESGSLFALGNNLTEVKLPNVKVKAVNISNNKFTLATIPATANVTTLTYAPQQAMEIADIDGTIDLSAQNNLTGFATEAKPTVYTWITEANDTLVAGTDYTEDAGKFTFVKEQAQKVYCTMTTEALPKFTGASIFKTIAVTVKAAAGGSTETQPALITLTAEVDGAARTFEFGSGVADNKISIDWGDGTIVDGATIAGVYDGWEVPVTVISGKPVGGGEIKIYATGAVTYFGCVSNVSGPGITKLDVSNATDLTELYANGNKLTSFDGSKLTKLSKVYLNNNQLTSYSLPESVTYLQLSNNQLTSFDGSKFPLVTSLYLSDNTGLGTLDVSMMPVLKSLYALNCGLTSVNAPLKVAKAYISVNNNKLETLDVSEATGLESGYLYATGNNLTEVKLPNVKVKTVNISNNKFTLATIPATANVTTLTYAPQQDMEIADIDGTIDLSAQNNLTGFATEAKPTVYTWITEANDTLVAGTDYTEDAGKFTFVKEQAQKVYCTMTTEALPKFTGASIFKTIAVTVKVAGGSTETQTPLITLTADVSSAARTFEFGSGVADNKISIDWGDGNIVDGATIAGVFDGYTTTPVTGTPVGSGEIKIYATGAVTYFGCVSNVSGPGITKLDVSNATELTELYANGNKLTSFDGSKLTKLSKVYLNNNQLTSVSLPESVTYLQLANNQLTSFDGSKFPLVTTLYLSDNTGLGTLDVSMMPVLKSLYALNCGLTSVNAPLKVAKAYISVNNNKLETLDVSEATGLDNGSLFAMGNNLTEVKLPNVKVKAVNISNNKFTLATIPATANVTTLTYAPQQDMEIAEIDGTIDLSAQNNLTGFATEAKPTVYTWITEANDTLVAGTDYTEDAGKFTFVKEQAQKVYCTMTTEALPKFTGANIFKTIAVTVKATATGIENIEAGAALTGDIYSVDGKLIKRGADLSDMQKGLYIIKTATGKTVKVSK